MSLVIDDDDSSKGGWIIHESEKDDIPSSVSADFKSDDEDEDDDDSDWADDDDSEQERKDLLVKYYESIYDLSRNHPGTTRFDASHFQPALPNGYGLALGMALDGNEHVDELTLVLEPLLSNRTSPTSHLTPLCNYIRQNDGVAPALEYLALYSEHEYVVYEREDVVRDLLRAAVAVSSSSTTRHLHTVTLAVDMAYHVDAFCTFVPQATCLRKLEVVIIDFHDDLAPDRVAHALGANRSLESLSVLVVGYSSAFVDSILVQLSNHLRLKDLHVYNLAVDDGFLQVTELPILLRSSTLPLRSLILRGFFFDYSLMQEFLHPLRTHSTLYKLALIHCQLDIDAEHGLAQFCAEPPTANVCPIRHIEFNYSLDDDTDTTALSFTGGHVGRLAARLVLGQLDDCTCGACCAAQRSSFGSSIRKLTLNMTEVHHFFAPYARSARQIRLGHLELSAINVATDGPDDSYDDWDVLETYLPRIVYLRDLTISQEKLSIETTPLIGTLKRNGSLYRLHLPDDAMMKQVSTRGFQMVQAYLTRNYVVPTLLANPRLPAGKEGSKIDISAESDGNDGDDGVDDMKMIPSLFPTVVASMLPVEEMSPNMFLSSLLALGSRIDQSGTLGAVRCSNHEVSGKAAKRRRIEQQEKSGDSSWIVRAKQSIATFWAGERESDL